MSNLALFGTFFMYFKMDIIVEIIRQMTKITKCPIFLDAKSLLVALKAHIFMVYRPILFDLLYSIPCALECVGK